MKKQKSMEALAYIADMSKIAETDQTHSDIVVATDLREHASATNDI